MRFNLPNPVTSQAQRGWAGGALLGSTFGAKGVNFERIASHRLAFFVNSLVELGSVAFHQDHRRAPRPILFTAAERRSQYPLPGVAEAGRPRLLVRCAVFDG